MRLALDALIDPGLAPYVAEARAARLARAGARGPGDPDELRDARARREPSVPSHPPATELMIERGAHRVPARVFTPIAAQPRGILLDIHGGGFYLGSAARHDVRNRRLADRLGIAVVSIDYRLAPEHPWPAAPDDCEAAALWLLETADRRFGTTRFAITGVSAGATLAVTTHAASARSRRQRVHGRGRCCSGTYDLSAQTPAGRLIADEYFLQAYTGAVPDPCHPDVSPIYAHLDGLPPVLMVVGSRDILLEDNMAMAARLSAAGNDIDLRIYPECPHGFTFHQTAMARVALEGIDTWLLDRMSQAGQRHHT